MDPMSKQKRERMDAMYDLLGIERPQPLFGPGDIPTWPGPVTSQVAPEHDPSGADILQHMHEARKALKALATFDDEPVQHIGDVNGESFFLTRRGQKGIDRMNVLYWQAESDAERDLYGAWLSGSKA